MKLHLVRTRFLVLAALGLLVTAVLAAIPSWQKRAYDRSDCLRNLMDINEEINNWGVLFNGIGKELPYYPGGNTVYCPACGLRYQIPKTGQGRPICPYHGDLLLRAGITDESVREMVRVEMEQAKRNADSHREAAERGDAESQYRLGDCYNDGMGVAQDYTNAMYWYRKAAEQ